MERKDYEEFLKMIKALEGVLDWKTFFGEQKTTIDDEKVPVVDVLEQVIAAKNYDELDSKYKVWGSWVSLVRDNTKNMKKIVEFSGNKLDANNSAKLTVADVASDDEKATDINFFRKIEKTLGQARKDAWKNSSSFDKMEAEVKKVNNLLNGESKLSEEEKDKQLFDAFTALEESADKYLEHKVKKGANENAITKIQSATSMKDYIKERKAEIFRRQLERDTKALRIKKSDGSLDSSPLRIKQAEIESSHDYFSDLFDKLNISSEKKAEMNKIFLNSRELMYIGNLKFKNHESRTATKEEIASSFLTTEFLRNELLVGGGEVTPMMKQFMEGPEAFRMNMEKTSTVAYELLSKGDNYNAKNIMAFVSRDANSNVVYSYATNPYFLLNKKLFDAELDASTYKLEEERKALEREKVEKAAREKVKLEELKRQEKKKAFMDNYNKNRELSKSYSALAEFAKKHNYSEELIKKYTDLAKEYQEKVMFGEKTDEDEKDNAKEGAKEKKTGKVSKSAKSQDKSL